MSLEAGIIIGCIGLIFSFFNMSNVMDDVFKKWKEYLIHWKHFWITLGISSTLFLTTSMKEFVRVSDGFQNLLNVMNTLVTLNIIIVVAWFFYLAIFTLLFYLTKYGKKKDDLIYE